MTTKDLIGQELKQAPANLLDKVLVFLRFLKSAQAQEGFEIAVFMKKSAVKSSDSGVRERVN